MKPEINYRKKGGGEIINSEIKQHATEKNKNTGSTIKSRKKSENTSRQIIMKIKPYNIYWMQQKRSRKKVHLYKTSLRNKKNKK